MKAKVCIITGTPGTGKTHLTKIISDLLNAHPIFLSELITNENHQLGFDEKRETWVVNIKSLTPRLKEIIKNLKKKEDIDLIIIEGHFSDIVPSKFIDYIIVLRCHPDELSKRLRERGYKKSKIKENVQAEILGDCISHLLEKKLKGPIIEIETSEGDFDNIAESLVSIMRNDEGFERYALGNVDWLEELFKNDRLKEFFD